MLTSHRVWDASTITAKSGGCFRRARIPHGCVKGQLRDDNTGCTGPCARLHRRGKEVEAIAQTSSTHSIMSVGLVERCIPSALCSKPWNTAAPHATMLPGIAARPVSTTTQAFSSPLLPMSPMFPSGASVCKGTRCQRSCQHVHVLK